MKERFKVTNEKALYCRFHTQTGGSTLTAYQIDNNVVRTTVQALSAVLGGTQSLHTNSKDEALALPSDKAAQVALRTQQIIAAETGISEYPDPFGGSYVIEEMTQDYVDEASFLIEKIDSIGGAISAIENGFIDNEITNSAYQYQKEIENNERFIVGVNLHPTDEETKQDLLDIDLKKVNKQINDLKKLKSERDNNKVENSLNELASAANNDDNIMPFVIDCIRNKCTLGEIADTFRTVFGEYH